MNGDGLLDHVIGAYKALTIGVRQHATKRFGEFLERTGRQRMTSLVVVRKPVLKGVSLILNALSLGQFAKVSKALGYDDVYHNFLLVSFGDGSTWKVEKNHVIEHFVPTSADLSLRAGAISFAPGESFAVLVERAAAKDPRALWVYNPSSTNCQDFTARIASVTGREVTDPYARELLTPQDAVSLVRSLGAWSPIPKRVTDIAGLLDRVKGGDGVKSVENVSFATDKMSASYIPYSLHLTPEQHSRLVQGAGVRLKASDLAGSVSVHLTKTQIHRIEKAKAMGKGIVLKLSVPQLHHHAATMGGGLLDSLSSYLPAGTTLANSLLKTLAPKGVELVKGLIDNSSRVPADLKPFLDMGLQLGAKHGQEQLSALLAGLSGSKHGSGLFPPGYGGGLYAPGM